MAWARDTGASRRGGWLLDQPYLLLSLTSLFWAGNTVLGRFIVGHVPPITLTTIRWFGPTNPATQSSTRLGAENTGSAGPESLPHPDGRHGDFQYRGVMRMR